MSINPREIPTGAVRFNTDSSKMEVYIGDTWMEVAVSSPNLDGGTRGLFVGGWRNTPSTARSNGIDFITISSTGDATDFGDLSRRAAYMGTCSSRTRGIIAGGNGDNSSSAVNTIDFITISTTGDSQDFGDLPTALNAHYGHSNNTRGVFATGYNPSPSFTSANDISVLTIASTGSAFDGGDLSRHGVQTFTFGNGIRGIYGGGYYATPDGSPGSPGYPVSGEKHILVNIATHGEVTTFGDFQGDSTNGGIIRSSALSNSTRGIRFSGYTSPYHLRYDKYEIASLGNAVDFGDLTQSRSALSNTASSTRAVFSNGFNPGTQNTMDYAFIPTKGDAVDFGNSLDTIVAGTSVSNGHGGLS